MIRNYIKTAYRNLVKQKGLTLINVISLAMGIGCFSLFLLYAVHTLNHDRFHAYADDIYRVYRWTEPMHGEEAKGDAHLPMPLGPAMLESFPDVQDFARFSERWGTDFIRVEDEVIKESVAFADPSFFDMFTFPALYGALADFRDPRHLILTRSMAEQLFGTANPTGRSMNIMLDGEFSPFEIAAVVEDPPASSSLKFGILLNFEYLRSFTSEGERSQNRWTRSAYQTFVLLQPESSLPTDKERLASFRLKYYPDEESHLREQGFWTGEGTPVKYKLQPLTDMHTQPEVRGGSYHPVNPRNIWILMLIAGGILLVACINFTTLAIGRSASRAREVGVRKVIGSGRKQLIGQFLVESLMLGNFSALLGIGLSQLLLDPFNHLAGTDLEFSFSLYPEITWLMAAIIVAVGLLAGSYPAFVLSGFKPIDVFRNKVKVGGSNPLTWGLLTLQFTISIALITCMVIMIKQVNFLRTKHPGFNKENVIVINAEGTDTDQTYPLIRQKLEQHPSVLGVASAELGLGAGTGWARHGWEYLGQMKEVYEYYVDDAYFEVMGLELLSGRPFDPQLSTDSVASVIINESMAADFGWGIEEAIGEELHGYSREGSPSPRVVGVVKNFNFRPLSEEVQPQMFHQFADYSPYRYFVRIEEGDPSDVIGAMESAWSQVIEDVPFTYSFLDEDINRFYQEEARWSNIVSWAGGISVFLACLGIFGMAMLTVVNKTKELGIRKVLGASAQNIIYIISKDFMLLVLLAILLATPVAWFAMSGWLEGFAYRIPMSMTYFLIAGLLVLTITFITVLSQGVRALFFNPLDSLRDD